MSMMIPTCRYRSADKQQLQKEIDVLVRIDGQAADITRRQCMNQIDISDIAVYVWIQPLCSVCAISIGRDTTRNMSYVRTRVCITILDIESSSEVS
jgi:hypothetical protein